MPPDERPIPRYIAEHPREALPYGRWAEALANHFLEACRRVEPDDDDIGDPGQITWFPDRTYGGRTYVPATSATTKEPRRATSRPTRTTRTRPRRPTPTGASTSRTT